MKGSFVVSLAISAGAMVSLAHAETVVTTTPGALTYSGVLSEVNPTSQVIILKSDTSAAPVTYTYTPQTVFLDASGNTVSYETIRNVPVNVEYYSEGGKTVVRRVVAVKPASQIIEKRVIEKRDHDHDHDHDNDNDD